MRNDEARPRKRRRPPTRRKTVRWSAGEVEALLAGVRAHGVGKWAAILRHSKVFNGVRTSVDLKDKWRNLTSPVRAAALAARDPIADPAPEGDPQSNAVEQEGPNQTQTSREPSPLPSPSASPHASPNHSSPAHSQSDLRSPVLSSAPSHPQEDRMQPIQASSNQQTPVRSPSHSNPHSPLQRNPPDPPRDESPPAVAPMPPPPSESSVSPDLLSTPSSQPPPISNGLHATPQFSAPFTPPFLVQPPGDTFQNALNPQMAAMQTVVNHRLYQSAAAIAAYWRRLGHDPNPYTIAAALTASGASGHYNPYFSVNGVNALCGAQDEDDDDDDDDDDDEQAGLNAYPFSTHGLYGKNIATIPFNHAFANSMSPVSPAWPMMPGSIPVQCSSPNVASHTNPQTAMATVKKESGLPKSRDDAGPSSSGHFLTTASGSSVIHHESTPGDGTQVADESEASDEAHGGEAEGGGNVKVECEIDESDACIGRSASAIAELGGISDVEYMSVNGFPEKTEKDSDDGEIPAAENLAMCDLDVGSTAFASQEGDRQMPSITDF